MERLTTLDPLFDRRGSLWIRQGRDTFRLDTGAGQLESIPGLPPVTDRSRLYEDRRGTIWAATDHGLFVRANESWRRLGAAEGLPSDSICSLLEDFEGSIWLGTAFDGLARWRGRDRFTAWSKASGLPADIVWALARTADGRIAFGTGSGHALASPGRGELTTFDSRDLPGGTILAVEPDAAGGLWLGFVLPAVLSEPAHGRGRR